MPTQSPEQHPERQPHQHREMAESFGVDAERYDRARPRYPRDMVERIAAAGRELLDVGCGTGIVARQLRAAGCTVLGLEPDVRMAAFARRDGTPVEEATIEAWDPAGRTFDAVVAGQTWHWVEPVAGAAAAARVLRPGGLLAVFWNVGLPPTEYATAFAEVYRRLLPDSLHTAQWERNSADPYAPLRAKAVDGIERSGVFAPAEQWRYDWSHSYTRDEWLDMLPTTGGHTRLPADVLAEVCAQIGAAIDALGGSVPLAYATVAVAATRTR